jgi:hypothetical protein
MKYVEQYMTERLKLQPLGKVTFEGLQSMDSDETYGYSVIIDGKDTGLEIWWADYSMWLEDKLTELGFDNQQNKIHL